MEHRDERYGINVNDGNFYSYMFKVYYLYIKKNMFNL